MPATDDLPQLLRRDEAAERLALSVSQLDRLVRARKIGVVRFGRSVRFTEHALREFIGAHDMPPRAARRRTSPAVRPINHYSRRPGAGSRSFRDALN